MANRCFGPQSALKPRKLVRALIEKMRIPADKFLGMGIRVYDDDKTVVTGRGVWDRVTPKSCRWFQSGTNDGGKTWDDNWFMEWTRVG